MQRGQRSGVSAMPATVLSPSVQERLAGTVVDGVVRHHTGPPMGHRPGQGDAQLAVLLTRRGVSLAVACSWSSMLWDQTKLWTR